MNKIPFTTYLTILEKLYLKIPINRKGIHIHPNQDEWFYILEGDYLFQVGEDKHSLKSGDTIFLPRNVPHAFIQLSEKGKMIVSFLPAGKMESFFEVTDNWTSPPTKEELSKVFLDHDMKIVGPPLKAE